MQPKLPPIVYVDWIDSNGGGGWRRSDQAGDEDLRCWAVGFLVKSTRDRIAITVAVSALGSALDILEIPRCAIRRIAKLGGAPEPIGGAAGQQSKKIARSPRVSP